jgi:hypothetical protein
MHLSLMPLPVEEDKAISTHPFSSISRKNNIRNNAYPLFSSLLPPKRSVAAATTSCDPCIDRTEVNIAVVHHGVPAEGEMMIGIF